MKRQKCHLKALVTTLALMLTLSAGPVFPGTGEGEDGGIPSSLKFPPVEEEVPETEANDGIQPLIDKDERTTEIEA